MSGEPETFDVIGGGGPGCAGAIQARAPRRSVC